MDTSGGENLEIQGEFNGDVGQDNGEQVGESGSNWEKQANNTYKVFANLV